MARHGAGSVKITKATLAAWGTVCHLQGARCTRVATTRDHLIPYSLGGPDELGNLRPACHRCNASRGNRLLNGYGAAYTVVLGPPCAGKTAHVAAHARPGDVVVDLDRIAAALQPEVVGPTRDHPRHLRHVAIGARRAALERAMRTLQPGRTWIVHGDPSPADLDLYRLLRYELVTVDPGRDVVETRAGAQLGAYVSRWYARHGDTPPEPEPQPELAPVPTASDHDDW